MTDTPKLIVADSDDRLREHLVGQLLAEGMEAEPARTPAELRCRAARGPDMLVLGEFDQPTAALELLREIRTGDALVSRLDPSVAVLMLSGAAGEWVPLRAFEAGCDDFLGKPVSYLELRARVGAILRRTMRGAAAPRRVGALAVDLIEWRRATPARGSSWRDSSSRCSAGSPTTRCACSRSTSCCATSGASVPSRGRGRSTRTLAGSAASSAKSAPSATSSTSAVSLPARGPAPGAGRRAGVAPRFDPRPARTNEPTRACRVGGQSPTRQSRPPHWPETVHTVSSDGRICEAGGESFCPPHRTTPPSWGTTVC